MKYSDGHEFYDTTFEVIFFGGKLQMGHHRFDTHLVHAVGGSSLGINQLAVKSNHSF